LAAQTETTGPQYRIHFLPLSLSRYILKPAAMSTWARWTAVRLQPGLRPPTGDRCIIDDATEHASVAAAGGMYRALSNGAVARERYRNDLLARLGSPQPVRTRRLSHALPFRHKVLDDDALRRMKCVAALTEREHA
jgi:hypothetical protein